MLRKEAKLNVIKQFLAAVERAIDIKVEVEPGLLTIRAEAMIATPRQVKEI